MGTLHGKIVDPPNGFPGLQMKEYDVLINQLGAGGGYGDPLDRDPQKTAEDVINLAVSPEVAHKVYGVVLDPKTNKVNETATEKARREIMQERMREAKPLSFWYPRVVELL